MALGSSLVAATAALAVALGSAIGTVADGTMDPPGSPVAVREVQSAPLGSAWSWPLTPEPEVVHPFDPPGQRWLAGHRGVDLAAVTGQAVLAPTGGRVVYSGRLAGRGVVVVAHADGLRSTLEPVENGLPVGIVVSGGESVGTVGSTPSHCRPAVCLHWGVLRGQTYLDPLDFVRPAPIVLLPLR